MHPRDRSAIPIERGFIRLTHGSVHYRAAGTGPVVLALHESPRSSLSMLPVIEALAGNHRVIAPDTAGYGLSDPLPGDTPSLDDFLDVIRDLIDAMGVQKVAVYGAHTGAALAVAFAHREPDRVTALVLDGLSAFTDSEVHSFRTDYLTPYEPHWDGRHVMGLWSRVKDLFTWFPWHDRTEARRLAHDPSDITPLHRSALGFLQAGAHYAKAYTHAAAFQPNKVIATLVAPTRVIARPDDLIADHLDRLMPGPGWEIVRLDKTVRAWRDAILGGLGRGDTPDAQVPSSPPSVGSRFVRVGEGWLHAHLSGPLDGSVRLLIGGLPCDVQGLIDAQSRLYPDARLVLLTPPGCGWSDPLATPATGLGATIEALDAALSELDFSPTSAAGQGAGIVLAELLKRSRGWKFAVEQIDAPAWLADGAQLPDTRLLQSLPPQWDGSHLTSAWFQLRDLALYDIPPGTGTPTRAAVSGYLDVAKLDRLFRAYVQGPECADLLALVVEHVRSNRAVP